MKRGKRTRENSLPPTQSLLDPSGHSNFGPGVVLVLLAAARDDDYDGVSGEGRLGLTNEAHSLDESNFSIGDAHVRLGLPIHASPASDYRCAPSSHQQQHPTPPWPFSFLRRQVSPINPFFASIRCIVNNLYNASLFMHDKNEEYLVPCTVRKKCVLLGV